VTSQPAAVDEARVRVRLYVAGESPNSMTARTNLTAVIEEFPACGVLLEVINVLQSPERGLDDGVLVTPMLVKVFPLPERRILGNLRNRSLLLSVLGIGESS
jgi:circadian clock protein KaiB